MGISYGGAGSVAAANIQWKATIAQGAAEASITQPQANARAKCPGCGSWELSPTRRGPVCSYCRVPAGLGVSS